MSDETDVSTDGKIVPIELTPQQKQQWEDTMSLMAWTCPGFRHLFYKVLANNNGKYGAVMTRDVPVAATDGRNILINPDTFFTYDLKGRVFIIGHEIVHNIYDDVTFLNRCVKSGVVPMVDGTTKPFINELMQKSMDYRINALLVDSRIGSCPKDACFDVTIAVANDTVTEVYRKIYEDEDGKGNIHHVQAWGGVMPPGASTGGHAPPRSQQQWAVEIASAQTLENMKSQGKMPGALQRMFNDILHPEVPWTEHIQGIFNRRVGSGSYNWRRPDRRFIVRDIHMPSRSGHGAGWVVIWGDTSGSIGNKELCSYMAELQGIIEDVRPRRLTILWCDAAIHRIDEVEEASDLARIHHEGVGGGGGTSVHPVMDWIAEHTEAPDVFIGFTDGYVSFPKQEPSYTTIWASTTDQKYPYGEVVRINTGK